MPSLGIRFRYFPPDSPAVKEVLIVGTADPKSVEKLMLVNRQLTSGKRETLHAVDGIIAEISIKDVEIADEDEPAVHVGTQSVNRHLDIGPGVPTIGAILPATQTPRASRAECSDWNRPGPRLPMHHPATPGGLESQVASYAERIADLRQRNVQASARVKAVIDRAARRAKATEETVRAIDALLAARQQRRGDA